MCVKLGADALTTGEYAVIAEIKSDGNIQKRLAAFGLVNGARIKLVRRAPLGDPLEIYCRGVNIAIRSSDASNIIISKY